MAVEIVVSEEAQKDMLDALDALIGTGGKLKFYSGTPPADCEAALSGNTLLGTANLNSPAFNAAATGTNKATMALDLTGGISDTDADAAGTMTFARFTKSDDTVVIQCNVATSGAAMNAANATVALNGTITVNSFTLERSTGTQM